MSSSVDNNSVESNGTPFTEKKTEVWRGEFIYPGKYSARTELTGWVTEPVLFSKRGRKSSAFHSRCVRGMSPKVRGGEARFVLRPPA